MAHFALAQVARGEMIGKGKRIRAGDLHRLLDAHVPQSDILDQAPILKLIILEALRDEHVVVDAEDFSAMSPGGIEEGRLADPRVHLHDDGVIGCGHVQSPLVREPNISLPPVGCQREALACAIKRRPSGFTALG